MRVTLLLRAINNQNLESLKKVLNSALAEAPQYLDKLKKDQRKIVFERIEHLNKWYTKIIGLDEVKVYQDRVTSLQDQLLATQTKRRELNRQLTEVRQQAQEIQSQIQHIDRKEKFDVYCQLISGEREVLNLERSVSATFQEYDQAERDLFTAFTNAVRDSQEKQRSQLEYSKYFGLTLSIIGSFLAFLYTFFWRQDLKLYIDQKISSINVGNIETSIVESINHHMQDIKQLERSNREDILINKKVLRNVINHMNNNETQQLDMPLSHEEASNLLFTGFLGGVGTGLVIYIFGKIVFG
ncbi:uncharacterized protein [Diabrotica undecimpunctata]|uniref:uncharacterized protein n=1 Tax=Diabrotica undecimpunctata TaxID=50387 RepID=UPI003B63FD17